VPKPELQANIPSLGALSVLLSLFIEWKLDNLRSLKGLKEIFRVHIIKTCPDGSVI